MMAASKVVIYTAIFGKKDPLYEPKYIPKNCDFVCFTDQPFRSKVWQIRHVEPPVPGDGTRSNRYYKILAHKIFPEYETSIYVDGNVEIVGDITALVEKYLPSSHMALLDHSYWKEVPLSSVRTMLDKLLEMERIGKHQENAELMERQANHYFSEGFPDTGGLVWTMVLVRRHNEKDVVNAMEAWWKELNTWSKRDQLGFNYIAWKTGFKFSYISLDGSSNEYFRRLNHRIPRERLLWNYMLGAIKRIRRIIANT